MTRFFSEELGGISPYTPGEQPQDKKYIKLNTNESPFAPAKGVAEAALKEGVKLNLYSDPTLDPLKEALAKVKGVKPENITCGNGSDEVLFLIYKTFCSKTRGMACPDVSYGFYPVLCNLLNIPYTPVPLKEDFTINPADYAAVESYVCIANPNAQTGIYLDLNGVEELLKQNKDRLVVVDEAYIDFGGESAVSLINTYDNLIVVQTMSKSRSLAGGRVGYAIACKDIIADLEAVRYSFNPYNINRMSMFAAVKSLKDEKYFKDCTSYVQSVRKLTVMGLENYGFEVLPSSANFVLAKSSKIGGRELYLKLKEKGVLVRNLPDERIKDYIRVTIGSDENMATFLKKIKEIFEEEGLNEDGGNKTTDIRNVHKIIY